jgi:hypothetical protein
VFKTQFETSADSKGKARQKAAIPWNIRTCFKTIDVTLDAALEDQLLVNLDEVPGDVGTDFDVAVHFQLLHAEYNRL